MKVTCRSCSTVREITPPAWVVASGKPFQMTCASCGEPQSVDPRAAPVSVSEAPPEPANMAEQRPSGGGVPATDFSEAKTTLMEDGLRGSATVPSGLPSGHAVSDLSEAKTVGADEELPLAMPSPSGASAAPSTGARTSSPGSLSPAGADRRPMRPGFSATAVPFDSENREDGEPAPRKNPYQSAESEDEPTEPSQVISAEEVRATAAFFEDEEGFSSDGESLDDAPVVSGPPVPEGLAAGAYVVLIDNEIYEAPTRTELYRWIDDQRVHADDLVASPGSGWRRARDVPAIARRIASPRQPDAGPLPVVVGAPPGGDDPPRIGQRPRTTSGTVTVDGDHPRAWLADVHDADPASDSGAVSGFYNAPDTRLSPEELARAGIYRSSLFDQTSGKLGMLVLAAALAACLVAAWQALVGFPGAPTEQMEREASVAAPPVVVVSKAMPMPIPIEDALPREAAGHGDGDGAEGAATSSDGEEELALPKAPPGVPVRRPVRTTPRQEVRSVTAEAASVPEPVVHTPSEDKAGAASPASASPWSPAPRTPTAPAPSRVEAQPKPAAAPAGGKTYRSLVDAGWAAVERNDLAGAYEVFSQAQNLDSVGADAQYGLGYALVKRGRLTEGRLQLCRARPSVSAMDRREIDGVLEFHGLSCD